MSGIRYCFGTDDTSFEGSFATREEAAAAGFAKAESSIILTGEIVPFEIPYLGCLVIDAIADSAWDECGEVAEGWLESVSEDQVLELDRVIAAAVTDWLAKHDQKPRFFNVRDMKEHRRPEGAATV